MDGDNSPPVLRGVVKFTGGKVFRNGSFDADDLWVDTGLPLEPGQPMMAQATVIDPKPRFWQAGLTKDYASHLTFDVSGLLVVPGFIELQLNGAFGVDFSTVPLN